MTAPPTMSVPAPRLYLITPEIEQPESFAGILAEVLPHADVAAVLLRLAPADERTLIKRAKALAAPVQEHGAALLIERHAALVARAGADGAHLTSISVFDSAAPSLKPKWIAGCGGLHTRHDAMLAAEHGADYVMFGEPDGAGDRPSFAAVEERVAWWAEVFRTPCVGYAASLDDVDSLVLAGADFIAVGELAWTGQRGPRAVIESVAQRLTRSSA